MRSREYHHMAFRKRYKLWSNELKRVHRLHGTRGVKLKLNSLYGKYAR
jgi:hypothetical protein